MAAVAAASAPSEDVSEETASTRKKRKRRKRSRRAETAELSLEQEIQGIAEAAGEQTHAEVAQREDKVAEVTEGNWIGEQGGFSLEQLANAFDRVEEESAEDSSKDSAEDRWDERRSSKHGGKKSSRNHKRRELTDADIAAVEDSGAGALEDEHHVDPELDPRFTRSSDRFEAIRAGEAKARASQKAGRIARAEGELFRSGREDRAAKRSEHKVRRQPPASRRLRNPSVLSVRTCASRMFARLRVRPAAVLVVPLMRSAPRRQLSRHPRRLIRFRSLSLVRL